MINTIISRKDYAVEGESDDKVVDVDNSIMFYDKLRRNNVPAEMHIYPGGGHGFVFQPQAEGWMDSLFKWMKNSKWIN